MRKNPRIFVGPQDVSGAMMWGYRCGYRSLGMDARLIINREHPYGYPYDEFYDPTLGGRRGLWQIPKMLKIMVLMIFRFNTFHTFSGLTLLPKKIDLPLLKLTNKHLITSFIGSDIRCNADVLSGKIREEDCNNVCLNPPPCKRKKIEKAARFWESNSDLIISAMDTTQMLDHLNIPYRLLVLPFDLRYWKRFKPKIKKDYTHPIIVHATSRPETKGTYQFIDAIKRLQKEGYKFTCKIIQNQPNTVVREWLNVADVVFDQIVFGWHGGFAVESMAMGNPVLGYIRDDYKERSKREFPRAPEIPIVNVTHDTLYSELKRLLEDENLRHKLGRQGREYTEKMHDSKIVCSEILDILRKKI